MRSMDFRFSTAGLSGQASRADPECKRPSVISIRSPTRRTCSACPARPAPGPTRSRHRLDATGKQAEFHGALEPVTLVSETIAVKGAEPVQITVRVTRHGPLVSDAINASSPKPKGPGARPEPLEPLAYRWTALDES